jgi:hypothetical protein
MVISYNNIFLSSKTVNRNRLTQLSIFNNQLSNRLAVTVQLSIIISYLLAGRNLFHNNLLTFITAPITNNLNIKNVRTISKTWGSLQLLTPINKSVGSQTELCNTIRDD